MIFLAQDREDLLFTLKEWAKQLQQPRECDYQDLIRAAKFVLATVDTVIEQLVCAETRDEIHNHTDADWAGNPDDARSTTGVRITWCGCKLLASSATQAGLPALSSGEANCEQWPVGRQTVCLYATS